VIADIIFGFFLIPSVEGTRHPYYHHDLKPNQKMLAQWGAAKTWIYTNSLGFKDREIRDVPMTSGKYRVLLLGDSFTEGVGMVYEATFAGIFADAVEKKYHDVEVFNAGVMSYSPKLYYLKTKYLLEKIGFKFNEEILFIDISDIQDEIKYRSFVPADAVPFTKWLDTFMQRHSYCYYEARRSFLSWEIYYALKNWWQKNDTRQESQSGSGNAIEKSKDIHSSSNNNFDTVNMNDFYKHYYEERPKWTFDEAVYKKWGQLGLKLAEENMNKLVALCRKHNVKLTIAVYPWPDQVRHRNLNSRQATFWKAFAEKHNIGFINYFPDFINDVPAEKIIAERYIKGDDHWNKNGHKIIAEKLIRCFESSYKGKAPETNTGELK